MAKVIEMIVAAAGHSDPWVAARDVALLEMFVTMGLRCDEVTSLDLEHVEMPQARAGVWAQRKKKKQRVWVTMPADTLASVAAWVKQRGCAPGPLFWASPGRSRPLAPGSRLSKAGVRRKPCALFRATLRA